MKHQPASYLACVAVFSLLIAAVVGGGHENSCTADKTQCLIRMREVLLSTDMFWFGNSYDSNCKGCVNPDLTGKSIMSRLLSMNDSTDGVVLKNSLANLDLVDVTYNATEGKYYGCGNYFSVPAVSNFHVNPLEVVSIETFSLRSQPSITWPSKSSYQTLVMWDSGYFYVHAIYINVVNGDLQQGTAIAPYRGPLSAQQYPNPYLVAVFDQQAYLNPALIGQLVYSEMIANEFKITGAKLLALTSKTLSGPVAVNILQVVGDPFSMQYQKTLFLYDGCPLRISQIPVLETIFNNTGITPNWVLPNTALNLKKYLDLSIDITVEYMSMPLMVYSCCVKTTYPTCMFRANPFQKKAVADSPAMTRYPPRVTMTPVIMANRLGLIGKFYTLMMVDVTDAALSNPNPSFNVHWLVTDIASADMLTGKTVLEYMGPLPFRRDVPRTYMFLVLEQQTPTLDTNGWGNYVSRSSQCPRFLQYRCGAQLGNILRDWGVEKRIAGITWFLAEQDAYARQRLYGQLMASTKLEVCDGVEGYEDPCPIDNSPVICTAAAMSPIPAFSTLILLSLIGLLRL